MEPLSQLDDAELIELELRLVEEQEGRSPRPLQPGKDVPDEDVHALTDLYLVKKERGERMIPDVFSRGVEYDVVFDEITVPGKSAEVNTETYATKTDAVARAVEIGRRSREAG